MCVCKCAGDCDLPCERVADGFLITLNLQTRAVTEGRIADARAELRGEGERWRPGVLKGCMFIALGLQGRGEGRVCELIHRMHPSHQVSSEHLVHLPNNRQPIEGSFMKPLG